MSFASGSFSKADGAGWVIGTPVRVKAPDFCRNVCSAWMPFVVPSISDNAIDFDTLSRIPRCCEYLVHSRKICSLVSRVSLSHGLSRSD